MTKKSRHYQIRKYVICDIIDGACTDEHDVTVRLSPDCTSCKIYIDWKKSKLTIAEFLKKLHEKYLDESMPGRKNK